jgi:hypothetical protein
MRGLWQLTIAGAVVVTVLVVSGFLLLESGGDGKSSTAQTPPPTAGVSSGSAKISARAPQRGNQYNRKVVVRVRNKSTGTPLHDAKVVIHGEMTVPHAMTLYEETLREVARGEYVGPYTLVMPGDWRIVIVARSKQGDASTYSLPVAVRG